MIHAPAPKMRPVWTKKIRSNKDSKLTLFNYHYGAIGHNTVTGPGAIVVGSIIPGGRFVVRAPSPMGHSTNVYRTAMLPDRLGTSMLYPDGSTTYEDDMADILNDENEFCQFLGVSVSGMRTCKLECIQRYCCPIGYEGEEQWNNYWNMYDNITIVDDGKVTVYAETDMKLCDEVHVRVEVIDADADYCQFLGGVTNTPDAGTQQVCAKVDQEACAGEAVMLDLRGFHSCK
ncbi:hypothetical protein N9043_01090 [bacterium]|nr:hypothetical protein [bacterium]